MSPEQLMPAVLEQVIAAGRLVLPYWQSETLAVNTKADDSPVTAADMAAHHCLLEGLTALAPDIPVLSEEDCAIPLSTRQHWSRWWLVDPLDGTKEFVTGSQEFTLNVALIEAGRPVFGVVGLPASGRYYYGGQDLGCWCLDEKAAAPRAISLPKVSPRPETLVVSRRHSSPAQENLLDSIQQHFGPPLMINAGSSLKFCLVAEGLADCYPRLAPTSQWDTAAAQAILEGAGGQVLSLDGQPLSYPARPDFINPAFIALPGPSDWQEQLVGLARSACA